MEETKQEIIEQEPSLFHYTTLEGLKGIIENKTLWATHYQFLNDSSEIKYAIDTLKPYLEKALIDNNMLKIEECIKIYSTLENGANKTANEYLYDLFFSLIEKITFGIFISSFCGLDKKTEKDGLLSQWRGYGKGGGFAIEFKIENLKKLFEVEGKKFSYLHGGFGKVVYRKTEAIFQKEFGENFSNAIKNIIELIQLSYIIYTSSNPNENNENIETEFQKRFQYFCNHVGLFKHVGFEEENEVRFLLVPNNKKIMSERGKERSPQPEKQIHFNSKPYIKLFENSDAFLSSIKRILVGPSPHQEQAAEYVRLLTRGLDIEVDKSSIPYRESHH